MVAGVDAWSLSHDRLSIEQVVCREMDQKILGMKNNDQRAQTKIN